jgi:hypothetical protein
MTTSTKVKPKVNTNSQIRIVRNAELDMVIGKWKFYFPIMDDNEIIKMLISKGNLAIEKEINNQNSSDEGVKKGLMSQVLIARKNQNLFITDLTEEQQNELLKNV